MRVAAFLFLSRASNALTIESQVVNSSPMSQVVKLLEDTLQDLVDERTQTEAAYKKMDCLTQKTVEANNKLTEENRASIDQMKEELALMDSIPLTDEAQQIIAKVDAKNKDIKASQDALASSTEKFTAYVAELDTGIAALNNAAKEIVGKDGSGTLLAVRKLMSNANLSDSQKSAFAVFQSQAPEQYKSQVGAIKDLINNLRLEYQKEKVDADQQWSKDKASQEANLTMLQGQLDALQAEFEAGAGEAAAKMKRTAELNKAIETAEKEMEAAKKESDEMTSTFADQTKDFNSFIQDSAGQEEAMNQAIEVLGGDDAREQFQAVAHNEASFLQITKVSKTVKIFSASPTAFLETKHSQLSKLYSLMATQSAAVSTLVTAIDDMKTELNVEKDSIENSMEKCENKSQKLLEAAKEAAEQIDGFQARINALEVAIANEQETQKHLTEEVSEQMEIRAAAIKDYNEARLELERTEKDLADAIVLVKRGIKKLEAYKMPAEKTQFHKSSKTNPLATVINMLQGIQKEFETKKQHRTTEISTLDKEHNDQMTDIGIASQCPEDNCRVEILTPESIIGLLEEKRNQSIDKENEDTVKLNADSTSMADNDKALYGEDGKGGVVGAFSKLQPGCDYWMVNGPGRFEEISAEINALDKARAILWDPATNAPRDILSSEDKMKDMGSRGAGADAKKHEQEHYNGM